MDNEEQESNDSMISRRGFIGGAAAVTAAAAAGVAFPGVASAATGASRSPQARSTARHGDIRDVKHVVVMMQENRSYDHYFGTLARPGSAGFGDKQALQFANGQNIFFQPDGSRSDGFLLPYRLDVATTNAQPATPTMGYYEQADIPWQHALASAFTVGDHYHCGHHAATTNNRCFMWTGTDDPTGANGGPAHNGGDYLYSYRWITYPEILQQAGVSWQVYVNNDIDDDFFGDFTDNTVGRDFATFNPVNINAENSVPRQGLLARANVLTTHTSPPPDIPNAPTKVNLDYVLKDFIADCAAGLIPEISYVVAPAHYSEHPGSTPNWGAFYVGRVIQALHDNPELWASTLLILNYDENNGGSFFDHVLRPVPEAGTPGEGPSENNDEGLGGRVPLVLISPWTRGGWVAKETFNHTSVIQFMEVFTTALGKPAICPNISAWRRSVSGDLTSAIDFTSFDTSLPALPNTTDLVDVVDTDAILPDPTEPAPGQQTVPVQRVSGQLKIRTAPYQQHATVAVDRSAGTVTATMTNDSVKAASMQVFTASALATPFSYNDDTSGIPNTVSQASGPKTFAVDTTVSSGQYDFSIYGPDHFVRRFAGAVVPAGDDAGPVPAVDATLTIGKQKTLDITLANQGGAPVKFTLTRNDYVGRTQTVAVHPGNQHVVDWPTNEYGYYDVIVTANTSDGFTYRFAGHIG
ncbi:MAG: DUF756 domain-containing protein [Acidimicrobiaceae bacterium]|nr:DUF756 domain-containing protein [Acidimicrobiaceae bacterium]